MAEIREYNGWKNDSRNYLVRIRKEERIANIKAIAKNVATIAVSAVVLYGMMWLGAMLDYIEGV